MGWRPTRGSQRILLNPPEEYYLCDEFGPEVYAAGAVNGTPAVPGNGIRLLGPGTRTVVDTGNNLTIANGKLTFGGGVDYGNPGLWYGAVTRTAGRVLVAERTPTETVLNIGQIGFDTNQSAALAGSGIWINAGNISEINTNAGPVIGTYTAVSYKFAIVLRATGALIFVKGGAFTNWTLLFVSNVNNTATLYPTNAGKNVACTSDFLRVPVTLWLPTPLLSTSGAMTWPTTNGLGHAETTGLGSGGSGLTMLDAGTWSVAGGYCLNTPGVGTEKVSDPGMASAGDWAPGTGWDVGVTTPGVATKVAGTASLLTNTAGVAAVVGSWYSMRIDLVITAGSINYQMGGSWGGDNKTLSGTYSSTTKAVNTNKALISANATFAGTADNFSVKPLPISQLITDCQLSTTDVLAEAVIHAYTLGTQVGLATNLDRSFAAKCNGGKAAGTNDINLKEIASPAALTTNDTVTIAGVTYAITAVGALAAGAQTVTLASDAGVVAADAKVGLNWASWNGTITYFDGAGNIKTDEVKAGAYTNRLSAATAFAADKRLIVRKVGTEYRVFFNEALVGTTALVDAAAMAGKYHGLFSTLAANTITSMVVYDTGTVTNAHSVLDRWSS